MIMFHISKYKCDIFYQFSFITYIFCIEYDFSDKIDLNSDVKVTFPGCFYHQLFQLIPTWINQIINLSIKVQFEI